MAYRDIAWILDDDPIKTNGPHIKKEEQLRMNSCLRSTTALDRLSTSLTMIDKKYLLHGTID